MDSVMKGLMGAMPPVPPRIFEIEPPLAASNYCVCTCVQLTVVNEFLGSQRREIFKDCFQRRGKEQVYHVYVKFLKSHNTKYLTVQIAIFR